MNYTNASGDGSENVTEPTGGVHRRSFFATIVALVGRIAISAGEKTVAMMGGIFVRSGEDRTGKKRIIAQISQLFVKVGTKDTDGNVFVIEHKHTRKGGPARHVHQSQDEWFYVLEGSYIAEVGSERYRLNPGDSLFAPRRIPHAFAFVGESSGRLLIMFQPAGRMEEMFDNIAGQPGFERDAERLKEYGTERVGPPLNLDV